MGADQQEYMHRAQGVCARTIRFDLDDEQRVHNVQFAGGCNGNAKGVSALVEGMPAEWVIERCKGTECGIKSTSCPDQLAQALEQALSDR